MEAKQQMVAQVKAVTPMGGTCVFFCLREEVERTVVLLRQCGHSNCEVTVVPRWVAEKAGRRVMGE